jgi:hypothetical protein
MVDFLSYNIYTLYDDPTRENLESILEIIGNEKPVLIGISALFTYEPFKRGLKNIEFAINNYRKESTKEILKRIRYDPEHTEKIRYIGAIVFDKRDDTIKIICRYGPNMNILFKEEEIPYNKIKLKFDKKEIELNVAKREYLLVDKIFAYLDRKEEKDTKDIETISDLMKKYGYDKELLYKIFDEYSNSSRYRKYALEAKNIMEKILSK